MNKDIKDYLHFYLGCECIIDGYEHHVNGILSVHENCNVLLRSPVGGTGSQVYLESKYIKPILRPLSDMTDQEIDELASVLLGQKTHCYSKWRSENGDCIIAEWKKEKPLPPYDKEYDYMTMGMLISDDFSIKHKWNYYNDKGSGVTDEPLHNSHEMTKYLLSKHFDLFGLIDAGLAIDKTKNKIK